jgi:hypothetical protein
VAGCGHHPESEMDEEAYLGYPLFSVNYDSKRLNYFTSLLESTVT